MKRPLNIQKACKNGRSFGGISSGAAAFAATQIAKRPENKERTLWFCFRYRREIFVHGIIPGCIVDFSKTSLSILLLY